MQTPHKKPRTFLLWGVTTAPWCHLIILVECIYWEYVSGPWTTPCSDSSHLPAPAPILPISKCNATLHCANRLKPLDQIRLKMFSFFVLSFPKFLSIGPLTLSFCESLLPAAWCDLPWTRSFPVCERAPFADGQFDPQAQICQLLESYPQPPQKVPFGCLETALRHHCSHHGGHLRSLVWGKEEMDCIHLNSYYISFYFAI